MRFNKIHIGWVILIVGMVISINNCVIAFNGIIQEIMIETESNIDAVVITKSDDYFIYDKSNGIYPLFSGYVEYKDFEVYINDEVVDLSLFKPIMRIPGNPYRDDYFYFTAKEGDRVQIKTEGMRSFIISTYLSEGNMSRIFAGGLGIVLTLILCGIWFITCAIGSAKRKKNYHHIKDRHRV